MPKKDKWDIISIFVNIFLSVISIIIAFIAIQISNSTLKEMKVEREAAYKPIIVLLDNSFELDFRENDLRLDDNRIFIPLKNVGLGPAMNVKIDLCFNDELDEYFSNTQSVIANNGDYIQLNKKLIKNKNLTIFEKPYVATDDNVINLNLPYYYCIPLERKIIEIANNSKNPVDVKTILEHEYPIEAYYLYDIKPIKNMIIRVRYNDIGGKEYYTSVTISVDVKSIKVVLAEYNKFFVNGNINLSKEK